MTRLLITLLYRLSAFCLGRERVNAELRRFIADQEGAAATREEGARVAAALREALRRGKVQI